MRGLDVLIIRFLPFALYILFNINLICCLNGYDSVTRYYELHGNSAVYASAFLMLSLSNKRYHCIWNRAMYLFLIFVPIMNFADASLDIFSEEGTYITLLWIFDIVTCIVTASLAIRHYIIPIKRRLDDERRRKERQ